MATKSKSQPSEEGQVEPEGGSNEPRMGVKRQEDTTKPRSEQREVVRVVRGEEVKFPMTVEDGTEPLR